MKSDVRFDPLHVSLGPCNCIYDNKKPKTQLSYALLVGLIFIYHSQIPRKVLDNRIKSVKLRLALSINDFMEEEIKRDSRLSSNQHIGSGFCQCINHLIRRKDPHRIIYRMSEWCRLESKPIKECSMFISTLAHNC